MKIVFVGDLVAPTGFARVSHAILDRLHAKGHEIVGVGVNYHGQEHSYPYRMIPATSLGDTWGTPQFDTVVREERPDVVFILNDIWIMVQYLQKLHEMRREGYDFRIVAYMPIDGEGLYPQVAQWMNGLDLPITYTKFAVNVLRAAGYKGRLAIMNHGMDTNDFYSVSQSEVRQQMNIPEDKFVFLNANRNQPRKHIDLTVQGFAKFLKKNPTANAALHLHMGTKDMGWDLIPMFGQMCAREGVDPNGKLSLTSMQQHLQMLPISDLNRIYNVADVNVNTCEGEGWGLCAFETAACGLAQIQPKHTSCEDLWSGFGLLTPVAVWKADCNYGLVRGIIDPDALANQMGMLYNDRTLTKQLGEKAREHALDPQYNWDNIVGGLEQTLLSLLEEPLKEFLEPQQEGQQNV